MALKTPFKAFGFLSKLSVKQRQYVTAALVGGGALAVMMGASFMIGPAKKSAAPTAGLTTPHKLGMAPGQALTDKEAWIGQAGKDVNDVKDREAALERDNEQLKAQMRTLAAHGATASAAAPQSTVGATAGTASGPAATQAADGSTVRNAPFPAQRGATNAVGAGAGAHPTQWAYPPGSPGATPISQPGTSPAVGGVQAGGQDQGPGMIHVSLSQLSGQTDTQAQEGKPRAPAQSSKAHSDDKNAPKTTDTFLPINFTPARLLGGMMAPTGSAGKSNPVPALIELTDFSRLPSEFRENIAQAFVTASGMGDIASERVHLRLLRLSYITKAGQIGEEIVDGVAYGPDGMEGVHGNLVQKQGQILANMLLASIPAAIGRGFAQSTMTSSVSALGTTQSVNPGDSFRYGLASGTSTALDRLAQYYIDLANQLHPVVEIFGDQHLDLVFTKGTVLHTPISPASNPTADAGHGSIDHSGLMTSVNANE